MEILKSIKKNTLILLSITILVMYIILKDDFVVILKNFETIDLKYIFLAVVCFFMYIILHSFVVYKSVNKKEKFTFKESIKHNVITQFFNGITPFSTGGQPMEIYMLTKHDISVSKATNYILQNFIFYQIALVLFGIFAIIMNFSFKMFPKVPLLRELVFIGFLINTLIAVILLIVTFSKKITNKLMAFCINILSKINIIKDKEKIKENWNDKIEEFSECTKELKTRKNLFFMGIVLNFIGLFFLYIIPLFIVYSLHDFTSLNVISAVTSSAYVMVMGSFIPIPGASGGIEYGFTRFFGNFLMKGKVSTTLLLWRFITYYLGIIIGAIAFNFEKEEENKEIN